ncbi:molybdopterin adenylyltransferase [Arthrobacter crystallopoietes BAB-32]|uniref:Molybdopterin adenylyltransferase n=1 Tax=Arthrobacter crystallopoietes BAB-32 TaxID=1246476 RepID=N1V4Z8_9MICC|nr:MogA/MoaB family molybdenum cofactor biosynthesis protein [Arthrobacter crystallopoietes]EMY35162.1 molybdopterin adenylyltransferase [Arthrobacter crystallopoietes BAB-32]
MNHARPKHADANATGEVNRTAGVVIASNRAAAGTYPDRTGPVISQWLRDQGFDPLPVRVVPDGEPVKAALADLLAERPGVIITSGGTGITADDRTPEMTAGFLQKQLPGVAEAMRAAGAAKTPLAVLSRGLAGVSGTTFIVNLPGSAGGVRDGLDVLAPLLEHICTQLAGQRDAGHPAAPVPNSGGHHGH